MSLAGLVEPPEQAGALMKKGHSRHSWSERYFVLKGSNLFYFKDRRDLHKRGSSFKIRGFIPLENAKIETAELSASSSDKKKKRHIITITLHSSVIGSCKHPFYSLAAPTAEVQTAWVNAFWQAAIPRAELIQHLSAAGKLADVLAGYAQTVQNSFPVADAAVLSTGGRARTAAVANVGAMPGIIRQHKAAADDVSTLPLVPSDRPAPASVLARTTSGGLVSAPSGSVAQQGEVADELVRRAASAGNVATSRSSSSGSTGGGSPSSAVIRSRAPTPAPSKLGGQLSRPDSGAVALSAAAGADAAAVQEGGDASAARAARERQAWAQMKTIEEQAARQDRAPPAPQAAPSSRARV